MTATRKVERDQRFVDCEHVRHLLLATRLGALVDCYVDREKDVLRAEGRKFDGSGPVVKTCSYSLYREIYGGH